MVLTNDTSSFAISSVSSVSFTEKSSIVSVFTPNSIDFVPAVLATHRLGGIVSASNPQLTSKELAFQLETSKARALIIGQDVLETGLEAAKLAGIPLERCAVVQTLAQIKASKKASKTPSGLWTIHGLLSEGFSAIKRSSSELSKGQVHLKKGEERVSYHSYCSQVERLDFQKVFQFNILLQFQMFFKFMLSIMLGIRFGKKEMDLAG